METNAEIARLTREVARLRKQLDELRQFITIKREDELPGKPASLALRCGTIVLCNSKHPERTQAVFSATEKGPLLSLCGSDEEARLSLLVGEKGAYLELFGKGEKAGVRVRVDEDSSRGEVGVFDANKPRAAMKAGEDGSAGVAVMHDGGFPRALLRTDGRCGEFIATNQDLITAVSIASDSELGAALIVHDTAGRPAASLCSTRTGGVVLVNDSHGNILGSLPAKREQE